MSNVTLGQINLSTRSEQGMTNKDSLQGSDLIFVNELTFEDWKNGNIPTHPKFHNRPNYYRKWRSAKKKVPIWHSVYWTMFSDPQLMSHQELEKIQKEQKRIYDLAVKLAVDSRLFQFRRSVQNLPKIDRGDFIEAEIKSIEKKLSNREKEKVANNETSALSMITPEERDWILELKESYSDGAREFTVRLPGEDINREVIKYDHLFSIHVDYAYLVKLEEWQKKSGKEKSIYEKEYSELLEKDRIKKLFNSPGKEGPKRIAYFEYLYDDKYDQKRTWSQTLEAGKKLYEEIMERSFQSYGAYSKPNKWHSARNFAKNTPEKKRKIAELRKKLKGNT